MRTIIVNGDVVSGFVFTGPFANRTEAQNYADETGLGDIGEYQIVLLVAPERENELAKEETAYEHKIAHEGR